jgi:phosphopantothenoylcysteine decarboxylase/phosphopantothenate--cysteine ligase
MKLEGKKIIVGISGSIAAYKAILLIRLLTKQGAEVRVVMTPSSKDFVSPLVLSTFSKHPVWIDFHDNNTWNNHVELGLWGDVFVIVPASCNTLSKMASGQCDNLLIATYLSARCPIIVAPAMDEDMFKHPSTKENLDKLRSYGNHILDVGTGELASGLNGEGRMAEPEEIVDYLQDFFFRGATWKGKKVVVSAGPTQEAIDPVRFISNHSSGKMGIAIAEAFCLQGADVTLIAGPIDIIPRYADIQTIPVVSAKEMKIACMNEFSSADVMVMAAAVADFTPKQVMEQKIKKKDEVLTIELEKTTDILQQLGKTKKTDQILVGFALETDNEEANALKKLKEKNLDCIILNSLQVPGAGFGTSTNEVTIYFKNGKSQKIALNSKEVIASEIIAQIERLMPIS